MAADQALQDLKGWSGEAGHAGAVSFTTENDDFTRENYDFTREYDDFYYGTTVILTVGRRWFH